MQSFVLKIGGSHLDWPALPAALSKFCDLLQKQSRIALVVGGGIAADVVRQWDQIFPFEPVQAHWLAIDSLTLTARLLNHLLPESQLVATSQQLHATWQRNQIAILLPRPWMETIDFSTSGPPLPHDWTVTSDSIALRIASHIDATGCILIKSIPFPEKIPTDQWAESGFVDLHFPELARQLPNIKLAWYCLRQAGPLVDFTFASHSMTPNTGGIHR